MKFLWRSQLAYNCRLVSNYLAIFDLLSARRENKQVGDNSSNDISSSRKDPCPHHIGNFCPPGRGEEKCLKMFKKGREILMLVCSRGYTRGGGKGIFNFLHVGGGVWIFSGMNHYFFIITIFSAKFQRNFAVLWSGENSHQSASQPASH